MTFSPPLSILSLFSQTLVNATFHLRLDHSFVGFPFLLWSCHRHVHLAAKDIFVVTTGRHHVGFFAFLVVVLLVIFMPSFSRHCSNRPGSTDSNSHTVVLSNPISYSPASFSIPVKKCKHAYQSFIIVIRYGESTEVVRLQCISGCGKSTIKVQRKYTGNFFWRLL